MSLATVQPHHAGSRHAAWTYMQPTHVSLAGLHSPGCAGHRAQNMLAVAPVTAVAAACPAAVDASFATVALPATCAAAATGAAAVRRRAHTPGQATGQGVRAGDGGEPRRRLRLAGLRCGGAGGRRPAACVSRCRTDQLMLRALSCAAVHECWPVNTSLTHADVEPGAAAVQQHPLTAEHGHELPLRRRRVTAMW